MTYYEALITFRAYSTEEIEKFKFLLDTKDRWSQEDWLKARTYDKAPNSSIMFPNGHSYRACVIR